MISDFVAGRTIRKHHNGKGKGRPRRVYGGKEGARSVRSCSPVALLGTGGKVGPRAGLGIVAENLATPRAGIRLPDRQARIQSLYRLSYSGPLSTEQANLKMSTLCV